MTPPLPIGKSVRIRECGYDEVWLQDQILANPSCLGLGELEVMTRERRQSSGGRLDILLKNPEDDSMYEVEVMLGETDETHIIRTIEYWIREKRLYPQRQHYPVVVAESITRRFFDVIQVFSQTVPLIAIQAAVIEANGQRALTFSTILNAYEEPEDIEPEYVAHDETFWLEKASWTDETAKALLRIVRPVFTTAELNYAKNYIAISVNKNNYFSVHKRAGSKSLVSIWVGERLIDSARSLLDEKAIPYSVRRNQSLRVTTDTRQIEESADVFKRLGELVREAWS